MGTEDQSCKQWREIMGHTHQAENKKMEPKAELLPSKQGGPKWLIRWVLPTAEHETWAHWSHLASHGNSASTQGKLLVSWTCFARLSTPSTPLHTYLSTILFWSVKTFLPRTVASHCFSEKVRDADSKPWAGYHKSPSFEGLSSQIPLKIRGIVALVKATWSLI